MENKIRIRAQYAKDKNWYLTIIPPVYLNGNVVIQKGSLYFKEKFSSKEETYELGRKYLLSMGIKQEIINNEIIYE